MTTVDKPLHLTAEEIDSKKTARGGWTRADLAAWGVPWPAPRGWRQALLHGLPIPTFAAAEPAPAASSAPAEVYRAIGCVEPRDGEWLAIDRRTKLVLGIFTSREQAWGRADQLGMERITFSGALA